jgi:hypothetical protein
MKRTACALALLTAASLAACGGPTKYDAAHFSDGQSIQQSAGSYWKRDGWWGGLPKDVRKVAITQFSVEYVTENRSKSGADALSVLGVMEMAGVGKRKRVFDEGFKQQFPARLYAGFVDALKAEGLEVVGVDELTRHPAFAQLKTAADGGTSSQYGRNLLGGINRRESSTVQSYAAPGLPALDDGWFNAGPNAQAEARLIGDSGAQAGLRVRIRVALDDDGRAVLDAGSVITAMYEPEKQEWVKGKPDWVMKQRGAVIASGAMRDDVPVITGKEFQAFQGDVYTIDGAKFQDSVAKMYPAYARMAVSRLKG